jgi:hypothetical protein
LNGRSNPDEFCTNAKRKCSKRGGRLDGRRGGFRRPGHPSGGCPFFGRRPSTAAEGQGALSRRVGRTLLKMRGLHPTPANISTLAADRRNGRLQLKSASSPFPSVHRADLEGQQGGVDLARSPNGRRVTAICAKRTAGVGRGRDVARWRWVGGRGGLTFIRRRHFVLVALAM